MVNLLKYLKNDDIKKADPITGLKIVKSNLHAKANDLYSRLFSQGLESVDAPVTSSLENEEVPPKDPPTLLERLKKVVKDSTKECAPIKASNATLTPDFKMFEATGKRTDKLESVFQALMTVKPTSVESERAFSLGGSFCTKIRSRMGVDTLSALVSLKMHFKRQKSK